MGYQRDVWTDPCFLRSVAAFDVGPSFRRIERLEVRQGLTEGWVDFYDWYLEGEYVELDGFTPPGDFCVAADAGPKQLTPRGVTAAR